MLGTRTKSKRWFIPSCIAGALVGLLLTTTLSPAAQPRYDTTQAELDFGKQFDQIYDVLREKHIDQEAVKSKEELFNIAIQAIMNELGDKHGAYFSVDSYQQFQEELRPTSYAGVGVKLAPGSGGLIILKIFDNSALHIMNIKEGDLILAAGSLGEEMTVWDGKNVNEMVTAIKGPSGTDVNLKIKRGGTELGIITVQRVQTRNQHVFMKRDENEILTIRLTEFSGIIYDDLKGMLDEKGWLTNDDVIDTSVIKAVVLDLRFNRGGSLGQAIEISDMFLPADKTVVRVIGPSEVEGESPVALDYKTKRDRLFPDTIPRVVLVNGLSASASEIVAGALQVHQEVPIMGTKTFGKGSVQSITPLAGGTAIKTTIAIYLAGGTKEIDGIGVEPDAQVLQHPTVGLSADHRKINGHLTKISMDPEIDHQLHVAHVYLLAFITGGHLLDSDVSRRNAMNIAHGAKTLVIKSLCDQKGLRGCPINGPPVGFTGQQRITNPGRRGPGQH